ncbi:polyadenylate-binding protein-interacting protein 1-like isoform X2 [Littorina saxatilis]|uniref:polyadenylate-binding protein-interacting protein 1-like isoform X2 n=1 Tax=Littorina saxatilis TaxID=31220 RepID=UPI0038B5076B
MSQNPAYDYRGYHTNSDGDEALQRPRRPRPETEARLLHGERQAPVSHQPSHLLSVGAAEFVPRPDFSSAPPNFPPNMGPPPQMPPPHPQQQEAFIDTFNQMNLSGGINQYPGGANQFPPGGGNPYQGANNSYSGGSNNPYPGGGGGPYPTGTNQMADGSMDQRTMHLLSEFSNTMMVLTTLPANVRDYLSPLCDKLRQADTPQILQMVIEILYQQSIYEPNFRYTGARVVHFLCSELKDHKIFGNFKFEFLNKCQQDYKQREMLLKGSPEGLNTLCGLTLFMGELFLNVTAGTERLDFLPSALTDLVLTLLSQPSDVSVKTSCQLLKLAGGVTEDAMRRTPEGFQVFNNIFSTLNSLQSSPNLSQNNKLLMKSVLNLRDNNWGRPESRPPQEIPQSNSVPAPEFVQSEPVFYNQFGKTITREEAGYAKEEEEEENLEDYELTEEEERDFLQWQEENSTHEERISTGPPHEGNPGNRQGYRNGYPGAGQYQQWSTNDGGYRYNQYPQNYSYGNYPDDEGLTMDDEMEKAYEEFLSSQR